VTVPAPTTEGARLPLAQTIVVPLDGSPFAERALPVATALARRVGAQLLLVTTHWDNFEWGDRKAYLERIAQAQHDVATEVALINEHPAAAAIGHVVHDGPDRLLCMTTHGRGALRWAVLGSVAEQVVRESREPVLLMGRHCTREWLDEPRHMLVCVDGSNVAEPIIPVATRWAKALSLKIRVASVIHPLDVEGATHPNKVVDAIVERFQADSVDAAPILLRGAYIAGTIADCARALPATLLAMNTHARGGMARIALGSVAMGTVGLAECPVLLAPTPA
jgi:nucleotide-binding universal stress UspA family protein